MHSLRLAFPPLGRTGRLGSLLLACASAAAAAEVAPRPADVVVFHARVFTAGEPAWAEAVAVSGERIAAVGSDADVKRLAGPRTRLIDAGGRLVVPGFNDAHVHVDTSPPATRLAREAGPDCDPSGPDLLKDVAEAVARAPKGTWIFGSFAGRVLDDPQLTRFSLDEVSPDHPVLLRAWTGHGTLFNTRAMRELGLAANQPDPPGGFFVRLQEGRGPKVLSGRAHEYAEFAIWRQVDETSSDDRIAAALQQIAADAVRWGITSIQVMATGHSVDRLMRVLGPLQLPVRIHLFRFPFEDMARWRGPTGDQPPDAPTAMVRTSGTKWILDGTPLERFAFMRDAYADRPDSRGRLNWGAESLRVMLQQALLAREPVALHAGGDATMDAVLAAMTAAAPSVASRASAPATVWPPLRLRIEHGDFVTPAHLDRLKALGMIVVQNPSHFMIPDVMRSRYGSRKLQPLKSLLAAGVPVAIGSDGPMNPFLNILWAETHANDPAEAIGREDALRLYTRGSAYAERADKEKGRLQPGMLADLAVLSQDIFTASPAALPQTESLLTVVGGRVVRDEIR